MIKIQHILVLGRVQGVGFRQYTLMRARELNLSGWVRNLNDGRVEILVEGEAAILQSFAQHVHQGPPRSKVTAVQVNDVALKLKLNPFTVIEDGELEWQKNS